MKILWFKHLIAILSVFTILNAAETIEMNKYYYIKSVLSGKEDKGYWDLPGGGRDFKQGDDLHLWAFDKGADRRYMITPAGNRWVYISPANAAIDGIFRGTVEVEGTALKNGSKLYINETKLTGNSSQQFKVKDTGDGKFKIYVNSGDMKKIICADGGTDKNGTSVIVLDDNDNPACQWRFIESGRNNNPVHIIKEKVE